MPLNLALARTTDALHDRDYTHYHGSRCQGQLKKHSSRRKEQRVTIAPPGLVCPVRGRLRGQHGLGRGSNADARPQYLVNPQADRDDRLRATMAFDFGL